MTVMTGSMPAKTISHVGTTGTRDLNGFQNLTGSSPRSK